MRRARREHAGGEVAMMAVITKAMGAFLVLMILLLPYYKGDLKGKQMSDVAQQAIARTEAKLREIKQTTSAQNLAGGGKISAAELEIIEQGLQAALKSLADAAAAVLKLKEKLDQAASQINRLEKRVADLESEIERMKVELENAKVMNNHFNEELDRLQHEKEELEGQLDLTFHVIGSSECDAGLIPILMLLNDEVDSPDRMKAAFDKLAGIKPADEFTHWSSIKNRPGAHFFHKLAILSQSDLHQQGVAVSLGVILDEEGRSAFEKAKARYDELDKKLSRATPPPPARVVPGPGISQESLDKARMDGIAAMAKFEQARKADEPILNEMNKILKDLPHCNTRLMFTNKDEIKYKGSFFLGPENPLYYRGLIKYLKDDFTNKMVDVTIRKNIASELSAKELCSRERWLCSKVQEILASEKPSLNRPETTE